jgi:ribosomal protein S18 acetylase RimI-like enzyme
MKTAYRIASLDDVPALVDLVDSAYRGERSLAGWTTEEALLGGQRIDEAMLAASIADPLHVTLVFEREDMRVPFACVALEQREGYAYLGMVTVRPDLQGHGAGRLVLEAAEAYVASHWKRPRARMTVIAQRHALIAWYERRGYVLTGETAPFPYGDARFGLPKREDLYFVVLEKSLSGF